MLAKQFWGLLQNQSSVIHQLLKAKYFRRGDLMQAQVGYKPSYLWRSLLASRVVIEEGNAWRVGNGKNILIRNDRWIGVKNQHKPTTRTMEEEDIDTVDKLMEPEGGEWKTDLVEKIFNVGEADEILSMPLSAEGGNDRRIWKYTRNGAFTVRSAYHVAVEKHSNAAQNYQSPSSIPNSWKKLWKIQAIPRVRNFMWKACTNSVPTRVNLRRRQCIPDETCGMCGEKPETIDHILLHCTKVAPIWYASPLRIDMTGKQGLSFKNMLWNSMDSQPPEFSSLMAFTAWEIWNARNQVYFEGKNMELLSVLQRAQKGFSEYLASYETEKSPRQQPELDKTWKKPTEGAMKGNCDIAVRGNGTVGLGFVIRDHWGQVRLAGKQEIKADGSTTLLEGLAVRYALQKCKQYHVQVESLESDNLPIIESINGRMKLEIYVDIVVQDIKKLASELGVNNFAYVPRQANKVAHHIAQGSSCLSINHTPEHIRHYVEADVLAV